MKGRAGRPDAGAAPDAGGVPGGCWIDLVDPTAAELAEVGSRFGLHELAIEDAAKAHQRPKLERYDDTVLVVAKPARYDDPSESIQIGELLVFTGEGFVVSVRHGVARRVVTVDHEGERAIAAGDERVVLHGLLDQVVDAYVPIARGLETDVREIEAEVFSIERNNPTERAYRLKRQVLKLLRNVRPLVPPLDVLVSDGLGSTGAAEDEYFRDVADHARRLLAELEQHSALLSDVLQANLAQISVAQNEDMRRMSAWAAVFLVPTLLAGIWGMNFEHMPELDWRLGYPIALGVMAGTSFALWWQFRRSGWIGVGRRSIRPDRSDS